MDGIQAIMRHNDLTAVIVRAEDFYALEDEKILGTIKSPDGTVILICEEGCLRADNRFPSARRIKGLSSVSFSGDGFECGVAEDILALFHSHGIEEKFVSLSETGMTVYVDGRDEEKAWESALMLV